MTEDALFQQALALSDSERPAFLGRITAGDESLRHRIEARLAAQLNPVPASELTAYVEERKDLPDEIIGGKYKLIEPIGEGGMGSVWLAQQSQPVKRLVAVKLIKRGMDSRQVLARFEIERQSLAMMDHPNIAKVLDAGATADGRPFFVMELVKGVAITKFCDERKLTPRQRLELFIPVCHAIQHAHQKGIIHRDIKPSNVMIALYDDMPVPKVIDFGVAKATSQQAAGQSVYTAFGGIIGTPQYMSPEQATLNNLDVDTRTDIYSLGVLLYELMTGTTPVNESTLNQAAILEVLRVVREVEPVRPSTMLSTLVTKAHTASNRGIDPKSLTRLMKGDLDWVVMKCLEKDRARRYETANGLAMDVKRYLANEAVAARPPSAAYRFQKAYRRNKLAFIAAAAVVTALVVGILASTWQAVRATNAEREQTLLREAAEKASAGETVQRMQAEIAKDNEKQLRTLAQVQAYAADMKAVQTALQQHSRQQAVTLLDQYWPKPGEPDLRGVEWRYLWQAARGDEIYTWKHPGMTPGAHYSPDGKNIATACFDGVLRIWNAATHELIWQFDRGVSDENVLVSFCYSPDGATVATASRQGIALLDCATRSVKRTLELPVSAMKAMTLIYSPDGKWLAAALNYQILVWNTRTWEPPFSLSAIREGRPTFSPDSKSIVVPCRAGVEVWDIALRNKKATFNVKPASAGGNNEQWFLAQQHSDWLIAADESGNVAAWGPGSGTPVSVKKAHASLIYGFALSNDGKRFATGGFDQHIHIWDVATREKVTTLQGHLNEVWSLEFSPDDRYLISSSKDGTVKLWDAQTKPPPGYWMLDDGEQAVGFTPDGKGLISMSKDGTTLRYWNGSQAVKSLSPDKPFARHRIVFALGSQSLYVLRGVDDVQVYDANSLKIKRAFKIADPCRQLSNVSPDERWLAGRGGNGPELYVWDTGSGQRVAHMQQVGGLDYATFSRDSQSLAYATAKWEVKLWDIKKQEVVRTIGPHPWRVYAISFSPDGRLMASSSWEGDVRIVEVATGKEAVVPLYGHGSGVHAHSFSPDGATLISGGDDSTVRFWNVSTGREMLIFHNAGNLARFPFLSPTGELLVWQDYEQDQRVRVKPIPTLREIEKARGAQNAAR